MHSMLEIQLDSVNLLCLIPFVPSIVVDVDLKQKYVVIDPPVGLLDLVYAEKVKKVVIRGINYLIHYVYMFLIQSINKLTI